MNREGEEGYCQEVGSMNFAGNRKFKFSHGAYKLRYGLF